MHTLIDISGVNIEIRLVYFITSPLTTTQ